MTRDLMHGDELKALVRDAYQAVAGDARTRGVAQMLYDAEELQGVPPEATDRAFGVNNHLRFAAIEPGETILDVGCGAGIDAIIAARRTGPQGRVIALDFLPEMLDLTRAAARRAGLDNVETLEGHMEAIPLPDDCVDGIVSNGVINLSPRKTRVLRECARVLRSGGWLSVSDLVIEERALPPEVLTHPAAWAG